MPKPIVLTFVASYLPGYKSGGPVRTISNMVEKLSEELEFWIITADRDLYDRKPYSNVTIDDWNTVGKAKVFYVSPKNRTLRSLARLINKTPHDILYLNSFFEPVFTIRPVLAWYFGLTPKRPLVIAPRGEFSEGALVLKWWKKLPYLWLIKTLSLYRNFIWQASSEYEANDIRKAIGPAKISIAIVIASDLSDDSIANKQLQLPRKDLDLDTAFRVCFLSRITPMKNTDYALRVIAKVKVPVEFSIYGVVSDEPYWQCCQELIKRMPSHVVVRYHGEIDHANVIQELEKHDLFFFPTRGENYGHVIYEALSAGLPVLISDQTPWRNLGALGVGWDLPLIATENFCEVIEAQAALKGEAREAQRHRTKQYALRSARDDKPILANLNLFLDQVRPL